LSQAFTVPVDVHLPGEAAILDAAERPMSYFRRVDERSVDDHWQVSRDGWLDQISAVRRAYAEVAVRLLNRTNEPLIGRSHDRVGIGNARRHAGSPVHAGHPAPVSDEEAPEVEQGGECSEDHRPVEADAP
jgi:hypothetical protein